MIPANSKKSMLILGLFNVTDLIIFGTGIVVSFVLMLSVSGCSDAPPEEDTVSKTVIDIQAIPEEPQENAEEIINICIEKPNNKTKRYFEIAAKIPPPKLDTALAVNANTPGAANNIIQSVIFIVAANTDSKNETIGRFISPTLASASAKITTNKIIGTILPVETASNGL